MKKMIFNYRKHFIDKPWWYTTFIPMAISMIVSFFIFDFSLAMVYSTVIIYAVHMGILLLLEVLE